MYPGYFKIKIIKSDRQLSMQVLEMDEGLRGKRQIFELKEKRYCFAILSLAAPALYYSENALYNHHFGEICLRGTGRIHDNASYSFWFASNRERNLYLARLTKCIEAYKKSLKNRRPFVCK
jgi:hypothetical protein